MDSGLLIVLLIAMYVIPEILKRLKPKKPYQYPEFPSTLPPEGQVPAGIPGELSRGIKPPPVPIVSGEGMPGEEGDPFWHFPKASAVSEPNDFSAEPSAERIWGTNGVAIGIVWAEIIAPPVALRPMRRGIRRL
jgi:hypothetical protein